MDASQQDYDIIIVGGGMVGASLALALGNQPFNVAMIEAYSHDLDTPPGYDDRAIALSYGSAQIFRTLNLWNQLSDNVTPIHQIHVSECGHMGITRIDHRQENVEALGYVITARALGQVLYGALAQFENIHMIKPARLTGLSFTDDQAQAIVAINPDDEKQTQQTIGARLLVAADGGNSSVRQMLDIDAQEQDYRQTAITANISTELPHHNRAYERFTSQGPLALLPMGDDRQCSLVWTRHTENVDALLKLSDDQFLQQLQREFGNRLGAFTRIGKRSTYPLKLVRAASQVRKRVALIGNAAHTLHPIAGQGFNLGIRDVAALAQILVDEHKAQRDIGLLGALQTYQQWRQEDHRRIIGFTDNLVRIFSNRFTPLAVARNLGLVATDVLPPVKHLLAKHTMGMAGTLPRLARGLPL
ncbi:MAG: 2-octaprenyl-6-methoxyphenyl hydroxylase [Gammaproteobacteria bacterium]|jgi:2-octaprenyl-6-methoxyphenol hydroxylase